jgi:hypothetical protein
MTVTLKNQDGGKEGDNRRIWVKSFQDGGGFNEEEKELNVIMRILCGTYGDHNSS